jgi:hypothetical protein
MTRIWFAAATALTLMTGAAVAQTTTETTTTETTAPIVAPMPPAVSQTTSQRTIDANGVVTDHTRTTTSGTAVSPYGDTTTTRRTTETTTVR